MAFIKENFTPIGGQSRRGKAPQVYAYATLDAATTVDGSGYFNLATAFGGAYSMLEAGDMIFVVNWTTAIGAGGTVADAGVHIIKTKNTSTGVLDATNAVDLLVTNAD